MSGDAEEGERCRRAWSRAGVALRITDAGWGAGGDCRRSWQRHAWTTWVRRSPYRKRS